MQLQKEQCARYRSLQLWWQVSKYWSPPPLSAFNGDDNEELGEPEMYTEETLGELEEYIQQIEEFENTRFGFSPQNKKLLDGIFKY